MESEKEELREKIEEEDKVLARAAAGYFVKQTEGGEIQYLDPPKDSPEWREAHKKEELSWQRPEVAHLLSQHHQTIEARKERALVQRRRLAETSQVLLKPKQVVLDLPARLKSSGTKVVLKAREPGVARSIEPPWRRSQQKDFEQSQEKLREDEITGHLPVFAKSRTEGYGIPQPRTPPRSFEQAQGSQRFEARGSVLDFLYGKELKCPGPLSKPSPVPEAPPKTRPKAPPPQRPKPPPQRARKPEREGKYNICKQMSRVMTQNPGYTRDCSRWA